jgi:excinuclease ABC subunit C
MMVDSKGKVLYVGKASNLRNRVRSYFVKSGDERPSIPIMMGKVESVKTILTETEKEALILENNLIKQHRPRYNVNLRDDKSFFSLRLNVAHPFPRLTLVRTKKIKPDGAHYFGPYSSAKDARITLKFIQKLFPLRQCTERNFATCKRPCLNCQMGRCLCPCAGRVDPDEYGRMIGGVTLLLSGRSEDLVRSLKQEMQRSAKDLRFEEAARIRDRLSAVERTLEVQNVSFFHLKDQDVIALLGGESSLLVVEVLSFRQGKLLSGDSHFFSNPALEEEEILASFIKQYYGAGAFVPKEILVSHPIDQTELIEGWLSETRGNKVALRVPIRGQGMKLMDLALKNAFAAKMSEKQKDTPEKSLQRVAAKLRLSGPPETIEGYDISNTSGANPVGVKISFRDGAPDKSAYRQFRMKGFADQDDPGMIYQTIKRRLSHQEDDPLPDLFLIDGGKSQLNAAAAALTESLGEEAPPVAAIAKPRMEGAQERIFLPNRKNPITFPHGDSGLMLLMRVRDESHRFAHKTHTKRHGKRVIRSVLDDVPGIGPKKRKELLTRFGSLQMVLAATNDEMAQIKGITKKDAERIREHFAARNSAKTSGEKENGREGASGEEKIFPR